MTSTSRVLGLVLGTALSWSLAATPSQSEDYPSRPITLIIPAPPGGIFDTLARVVGQKVSESMGQPVVVMSRPGGGGIIASVAVKQAPADGYTLFIGFSQTHVVNTFVQANLPYDPVKDFEPIIELVTSTTLLTVPASSPAKTPKELVAFAKTKPQGLSYASPGNGTAGHLVAEMFRLHSGIPMVKVSYNGVAQITVDMLGERVDMTFIPYQAVGAHLATGKLRALAVTSSARIPQAPDVPTMPEAGYPDTLLSTWFGLFAPAGTPKPIVQKLNAEFAKALRDPTVLASLTKQGLAVVGESPEALARHIAEETAKLAPVIKAAGIKPE